MRILSCAVVLGLGLAATQIQAAAKKSLFDRLGGEPAITAVVDDFVATVAADTRINERFANADVPNLKKHLIEQICAGTGGPCAYTGKNMKAAHQGMGITSADFNALVEDLGKSLTKLNVHPRERRELVAVLAPLKKEIVENP